MISGLDLNLDFRFSILVSGLYRLQSHSRNGHDLEGIARDS
jgi:hypothetical protein